jgi:hypothetical protein
MQKVKKEAGKNFELRILKMNCILPQKTCARLGGIWPAPFSGLTKKLLHINTQAW